MKGKVFVFGSFNIDIVSNVPRFPNVGESIISNGSNIGPGGKGTNQAIAASNSNSEVYFSAKVGDDEFGKIAKDHLNRSNIKNYNLFISDSEATGTAIIYVSQERGDNMIAIYPGANQKITTDEINIIESEIYSSNILLVQLENNIEPIKLLIEKAKKRGVKVVLNPAPYSDEIISHLNNIYLITPNQTEASSLSGISIIDSPTAKQAASVIKNLGVENVIITMGEKGVLILENNIFTHIAAYPAVVVDTTGAGDAFNGAIAASLANGKDLISSAKWASAFASLAVEMKGASNMPTFDDVENKIAIQNKGKL